MSAEILRRAAALMRETAKNATAPNHPWAVDNEATGEVGVRARRGAGPTVATTIPLGYCERRANAAHIASWHPAVALAVADWLEQMARAMVGTSYGDLPFEDAALTVARTYLGEQS